MDEFEGTRNFSNILSFKQTKSTDIPNIQKLATSESEELFGKINLYYLIEIANLSMTVMGSDEDVVGHASFVDYPNISDLDPTCWELCIQKCGVGFEFSSLNTLFLHFYVSLSFMKEKCIKEILQKTYHTVPELHFCILIVPDGVVLDDSLKKCFNPIASYVGEKEYQICFSFRHEYLPLLYIRPAREEDSDDIFPLLDKHSKTLQTLYGYYYLPEMIDSTNESTISLVAEVEGFAVGFIYVSRNVDVDLLNECFQLSPFHGLRKIQEKDEICYQQSLKPEKAENHESSLKTQLTTGISPSGSRHSSLCNEGLPVKCRLNENGTSKHFLKASLADVISGNHIQLNDTCQVIQHPKPVIPVQLQNNVPSYKGDPSAVCVQLFCIDKMYETRSLDFLSKVFEMFPEVEYCIITVPHLTPEFPLLNFFTRIPPYPTSVFSQVLYVFHRAGLLRDFTVEKVKEEDFHDVSMFLGKFDHSLNMLEDVKQCLHFSQKKERKQIQAFVAKSYSDVVGIGIIGFEEDSEFLRAHYDIDSFCLYEQLTPQEHSHLHHFVINPIFNHLSKHFLKEILRLSGTINLYYQIQPSHSGILQGSKTCTVTVLEDLVPVCPRSMITYPLVELGVNAPTKRLLENPADFALYIMNKKLCFKKKTVLNIRIVVVGASEVGLAFLEALVMSSDLQFNYLTLVAPHGLPGDLIPDELRETFHPQSLCYCPQRLHQLCMSTWVNQVYGTMTSIDKELKVIEVDSKAEIPYDILILCCGNQWQLSSSSNIHSFLRGTGLDSVTPKPVNLFLINDEFDIATALNWIETVFLKTTNNAVVYGRYLEVYSSIATLLKLGVSGSQITLISPSTTPEESSVFSNYEIAQTVNNSLISEGVHMIENCEVLTWCTTDNLITSVTVQVGTQEETIDCGVLFLYDKKDVSSTTFKAINDANLVYDGRLVVDSSFQTNDPYIFAAGSLTKFSRKYCMDGITHQSFNSKEVGEKLAEKILLILNPIQHNNDHSPEPDALLTFTKPTVVYTNLPGGWKYLQVDRPGRQHLPYEESMHTPGHDIITGNMEEHGPGYFCLHLNQYNKVEAITCFTQKDLHTSNLIKLFGLHQSLLNNLLPKYKEGLITDLYSYFNESWCLAVYHDCFPGLLKDLRDIMISKKLNSIEKEELKSANQGLVFKEELEMHVLQFLNLYHFQLPMYAQQEMI